ncbi:kinase-like domain-containing protein [Leptodontidium sp. MPI-SDFR-AT-0119]|nr:kinase-like domain-containing protein [Leptodontidium sp. MPI-SDFR-AT-0119]
MAYEYSESKALGGGWEKYTTYLPSGLERVENLAMYEVGGLHPVNLGESYQEGRYKIAHKLGNGGFSTTWLARDSRNNTYVALKFVTSAASEGYGDLKTLRDISSGSDAQAGVANISSDLHRLSGKASQEVASQAVSALGYLHSLGICHGDFTSANVLFQLLGTLDTLNVDELYSLLGNSVKESVRTRDGSAVGPSALSYVVESIDFAAVPILLSLRLEVIDFDQAFQTSTPPSKMLGTPPRCLSPEAIFDHEVGVALDVWALGCLIFRIRSGYELFGNFGGPSPYYALMQIVKSLGKLPKKWRNRRFDGHGYPAEDSNDDAEVLVCEPLQAPLVDAVLEIERGPIGSLVATVIAWKPWYGLLALSMEVWMAKNPQLTFRRRRRIVRPEKRLGLQEIADHPWFKLQI